MIFTNFMPIFWLALYILTEIVVVIARLLFGKSSLCVKIQKKILNALQSGAATPAFC